RPHPTRCRWTRHRETAPRHAARRNGYWPARSRRRGGSAPRPRHRPPNASAPARPRHTAPPGLLIQPLAFPSLWFRRDCFVATLLAMRTLCCHSERSEAISSIRRYIVRTRRGGMAMPSALEEKDAIREVLAEYCFRLDGGDYDGMAALFAE